jgi:hypothetical protein
VRWYGTALSRILPSFGLSFTGCLVMTRRLLQTLEIPVEFGWTLCAK